MNGKPVRESLLSDGDILAIAETELTFVASPVTPFQRMVTQPIPPREASKHPVLLPSEIALMRTLTEATLWQAIALELATVVSLDNGEVEACFAQLAETTSMADPDSQVHALHDVGKDTIESSVERRRAMELVRALQGRRPGDAGDRRHRRFRSV